MAKLQKLAISGIRSFGPDAEDVQQIKFNETVTLFLGQNGCGKTTILEAIKYALSGELPAGCNNGQGFINDPSMSNSVETKGQVRLRITDGNGRDIIIIKSMQVTKMKAGALKFKALDSAINEIKDGVKRQFSGRCVDINNYCAEALQVSPCILNNVLLCHQENSAWPLEEGKKLKEKFDEIFESTRYNKSVDILKKQFKDYKDSLKTLKLEKQYKEENKERVEKLKIKLNDKNSECEDKKETIERKEGDLLPVEARLREILKLEQNFGILEKNLASKEATRRGIVEQQNSIRRNITTEFAGNDAELMQKIRTFQSEKQDERSKISQLENKKSSIESRAKEINLKIQQLHSKMGQLKEEKRQIDTKCIERKALIEKAKIYLKLEGQINTYDIDENTQSVIDTLKESLERQQEAIDNKMMEIASDEAILQNSIDSLKEKQISFRQNIEGKNELKKENEKKIRDIRDDLHDLEVCDSQLDSINRKILKIDKDTASLKQSFDEVAITNQIEKDKAQIFAMEKQKSQLDQEYRLLQKNSVLIEKLDNARELIVQKQTEINKLKSKHTDNFEKLFGQIENVPSPLKVAVKSTLDGEERCLKKLQLKFNEKQKEVTRLDTKLQHQIEKINTQESELQSKKKQIHDTCKGQTFEDVLKTVGEKRESLQKDKAVASSLRVVYEKFISKFQGENPSCPICKTNFKNKSQLITQIITELKNEIESVPRNLPRLEQELKKMDHFYNKLQQLKPVNDGIELLSTTTIPALQEELEDAKMNLACANSELTSLMESMEPCQQKIEVCRNLISDAAFLDQYYLEIQKSEAVIKDVEGQMIITPSNKSVQEIEAQIDTLHFDINDLRKKVDTDKEKLDRHKARLHDLRENKSKLIEKQLEYQRNVQSKPEKEKQLAECEQKVALLTAEIKELQEKLSLVGIELKEASKKKETMLKCNAKIIEDLRSKLNTNRKIIEDIERLHDGITKYIEANKDQQMKLIENEMSEMKYQEENIQSTIEKLIDTISKKREDIAKQESLFRELKDNQALREKLKEEESVKKEIDEIKNQIGQHNLTSVHNEKRNLQEKYETIIREINQMTGQKKQLDNEIKDLQQELNKPGNKKAFEEYRDKVYELAVKTAATDDLETYINVLEKSILEFHKDKMKQINTSIRELWRNIYRGNDIDYIEIKTEDASGNIKRRSYNYKVVQVKRGTELEMRGRCSAGQKVLACLVIRMALASIFSSKCGILALDEPTTNLDKENIASLSDSLSRIIADRQQQANFQLLIITHDEDFLDTLKRVQGVSNYYRVTRNERGNSVVVKEHL